MPGDEAFQVEGCVKEARPNGTYRVALANGHELTGFVAGRARGTLGGLKAGDRVRVQLTPYDLSAGRILTETRPTET